MEDQVMTWGEFKKLLDVLFDDDAQIDYIDVVTPVQSKLSLKKMLDGNVCVVSKK